MTVFPIIPDKQQYGEIGALDEGRAAPHVHLQGRGPTLLVPDPGVDDEQPDHVPRRPRPDATESRARDSVMRQAWRFAVLNLTMITLVTKGHQ
jgi:hypothetical protein